MKWDITRIVDKIKERGIKNTKMMVNDPLIWSCPSKLDISKLNYLDRIPKFKKPMILAFHPAIQQLIIIDGNHRYNLAKKRSQTHIDCVIIGPNFYLDFVSELTKNKFIVHHNLFVINNYTFFPKKLSLSVDKLFNKNSIYPILEKEYKFNFYRRIKYLLVNKSNYAQERTEIKDK